jgi:hypothetical protein
MIELKSILETTRVTEKDLLDIHEPFGYPSDAPPVFFGHYWLKGQPQLQAHNVCCLDYSVAKGGELVCYRFDGESILSSLKFVSV